MTLVMSNISAKVIFFTIIIFPVQYYTEKPNCNFGEVMNINCNEW